MLMNAPTLPPVCRWGIPPFRPTAGGRGTRPTQQLASEHDRKLMGQLRCHRWATMPCQARKDDVTPGPTRMR